MNKILLMVVAILIGGMSMPLHTEKKMIRIPHLFGVDLAGQVQPNEWLELDGEEAYSTDKFVNFIKAKQKEGLSFIMARVMTRTVGGYNVHYLDADFLHRAYGVHYPFHGTYRLMSAIDPLNRSPILNIEYFIISDPNAPAFEYLCSGAETLGEIDAHTLYRDIFYLNQSEDSGLRFAAARELAPHVALIERNRPEIAALIRYYMGEVYYHGHGVADNDAMARQYFEQAANQNINLSATAGAKYNLGVIYFRGDGVDKNYVTARQYFEQAANQNDNLLAAAGAKYFLGEIYYRGDGVDKNYVTARRYFEQITNQNDNLWAAADAKYYLGLMYYNGDGVAKNAATARQYFEQATNQNDNVEAAADAKYYMGLIYYNGNGVPKNDATARQYFEQVANQNDNVEAAADAKYYLGLMYYNGDGVPKNAVTARQYLEQVANQNDNVEAAALARQKLDELNQEAARARTGAGSQQGESSGIRPAKKQKKMNE
jgi:TPR repeat protein